MSCLLLGCNFSSSVGIFTSTCLLSTSKLYLLVGSRVWICSLLKSMCSGRPVPGIGFAILTRMSCERRPASL